MCLNYFGRCICFSSLGSTRRGWRTTLAWSMGQTNPVRWSFYCSLSSLNRYISYQFSPINIPWGRVHAPTCLSMTDISCSVIVFHRCIHPPRLVIVPQQGPMKKFGTLSVMLSLGVRRPPMHCHQMRGNDSFLQLPWQRTTNIWCVATSSHGPRYPSPKTCTYTKPCIWCLSANNQHMFLHDLHTGVLPQTIRVNQTPQDIGLCHVNMNKWHMFVRGRGAKVFWIQNLECVHISQVIYVYSFGFRSAI